MTTNPRTTYSNYTTKSNDEVEEEQQSMRTNLHAGQRDFSQSFNRIKMHMC